MTKTTDPREAFLQVHSGRQVADLPAKAVADLRWFAEQRKSGRPISFEGLRRWMREQHKIVVGRTRLATVARENKIEPWWSV